MRTGFSDLDDLFGGLRGGDLVILAARPSVGKTALALNIASRAAQLGTSVAFFSLEISATQLVQRVLSTETRINSKKMQTGQMSAQDWVTLVNASDTLSSSNCGWMTPPVPRFSKYAPRHAANCAGSSRKGSHHRRLPAAHAAAKHAHRVAPGRNRRDFPWPQDSRKGNGHAIIALSQLSRAVESRQGKRPILLRLARTGAIEQDADIVMFLDRSLSEKEAEQEDRPALNTADVIVAKHRNGPTGVVSLAFQSEFTRFDNLARHEDNRY